MPQSHAPRRRPLLRAAALAPLAALAPGTTAAQRTSTPSWPTRQVRIVVPFPASGTTDILARLLAERMGARTGQSFVVDNRPGAGGNIGAEIVARAEPDGHTVLMSTIGTAAINHVLYRTMPFRPEELAAICLVARLPNVVMVNPASPIASVADLLREARAAPGRLTHGSAGNGTSLHLAMEMLKAEARISMTHVPFRGAAPMLVELMAGRLDCAADNLPSSLEHIRAGRLRAIAVTTARRSDSLPEVPTLQEAGLAGFEATAWFGVQAPARIPPLLLQRMATEMRAALAEPAVRARIEAQGAAPGSEGPQAFETFIRIEISRWAQVIHAAALALD